MKRTNRGRTGHWLGIGRTGIRESRAWQGNTCTIKGRVLARQTEVRTVIKGGRSDGRDLTEDAKVRKSEWQGSNGVTGSTE